MELEATTTESTSSNDDFRTDVHPVTKKIKFNSFIRSLSEQNVTRALSLALYLDVPSHISLKNKNNLFNTLQPFIKL